MWNSIVPYPTYNHYKEFAMFQPAHNESDRIAFEIYGGRLPFSRVHSTPTKQFVVQESKEEFIPQMDDLLFAIKALLKYIPIYSVVSESGCIRTNENYVELVERRGVTGQVFRLRYSFTNTQNVTVDVVPNQEKNTADVRLVEKSLTHNETRGHWLRLMRIL